MRRRILSDAAATLVLVPWMYLAAAAGVLVLLRIVFTLVTASERIAAKAEEREENAGLRERVGRFTSA